MDDTSPHQADQAFVATDRLHFAFRQPLRIDYDRDIPPDAGITWLHLGTAMHTDPMGTVYDSGVTKLASGSLIFRDGVIITKEGTLDPRSVPQQTMPNVTGHSEPRYSYARGPWGSACDSCYRRRRRCSGYPQCYSCKVQDNACVPRVSRTTIRRQRIHGSYVDRSSAPSSADSVPATRASHISHQATHTNSSSLENNRCEHYPEPEQQEVDT